MAPKLPIVTTCVPPVYDVSPICIVESAVAAPTDPKLTFPLKVATVPATPLLNVFKPPKICALAVIIPATVAEASLIVSVISSGAGVVFRAKVVPATDAVALVLRKLASVAAVLLTVILSPPPAPHAANFSCEAVTESV